MAYASVCEYSDPYIVHLSDSLNARAKLRHGALAHIITARILDIYPTSAEIKRLVDNPPHLDKLCAQIAAEVLPSSVVINRDAATIPADDDPEQVKLATLPRNNSWSDLLQFERA
jgi:hypothetical protein